MVKVVIVDDHKLFRQGLGVMLAAKENIEVVAKYESAIELLKNINENDYPYLYLN